MHVFINIAIIIIRNETIASNYKGGIDQFKMDYSFGKGKRHQEDDDLFSLAFMNIDQAELEYLSSKGLGYDEASNSPNDFVIVYMHGGCAWKVDWLDCNAVFAWHKACDPIQIERAEKIGNMPMVDINATFDKWVNLFETIRQK